jgi:hypothetical protein
MLSWLYLLQGFGMIAIGAIAIVYWHMIISLIGKIVLFFTISPWLASSLKGFYGANAFK